MSQSRQTRILRSSHSRPFSANRTHPDNVSKSAQDGKKYPEIKQRGFYSDVLANGADEELGVSILFETKIIYILVDYPTNAGVMFLKSF